MKFLDKKNLTVIGKVNKVSGFKGEVSCLVSVAHPEKLQKQKFLFVLIDGLPVPFLVEEMEIRGEEIIVKFEDIGSSDQAKKLLQKQLYSEKIKASKKEDLISWTDLQGYRVHNSSGEEIG